MTTVTKKHKHESFESLMRRFKKGCEKSNILLEVKKREFYEKPTSVRKRKAAAALKREAKNRRNNRWTWRSKIIKNLALKSI